MKEFTTNKFYKGINTDMAWLERQGDMLLDGLNIRVTAIDTDGLFAANFKGNREEFSLSEGFLPIGATEYGGILFILSSNSTTGEGEIGTFPTPNGNSNGFTRIYSPLNNFTLDNPNIFVNPCEGEPVIITRAQFRTTSLKFSCEHQARLLARLDFDKSINLYWTDNFNPIRSINTGFHSETGEHIDRYVSKNMIDSGIINVISENEFIPIVNLSIFTGAGGPPPPLGDAGQLKAGHYFFFVRYTDISFNSSSFLGMSAPVSVFHENFTIQSNPLFGATNNLYGLEAQKRTSRDVNLVISGLDIAAAFVEVGYIYYFGENEFETKLIDVRHSIDGNDTIRVNVSGFESTIDLTIGEFIGYKPTDSLFCKDIAQLDNRLYLANTRGIQLDHLDIRAFFCAIKIGEDSAEFRDVKHVNSSGFSLYNNSYGRYAEDVNEKVGYFSGEAYVFSGVPFYKGGFTGPAFPMTGYDNYKGNLIDSNSNGIFRFSSAKTTPFHVGDKAHIKGVIFDISSAQAIYDNSQFLQENLVGIYFSRGERIKNILYQGIICRTYDSFSPAKTSFGVAPIDLFDANKLAGLLATITDQKDFERHIPLMEGVIPFWIQWYYQIGLDEFATGGSFYVHDGFASNPDQTDGYKGYGIFSIDYFLDKGQSKEGVGSKSFIDPIGIPEPWLSRIPNDNAVGSGSIGLPPTDNIFYHNGISMFGPNDEFGWHAATHNVTGWDTFGVITKEGYNFVSKVGEGRRGSDNKVSAGFRYKEYDRENNENNEHAMNLPIALPDYILVERSEEEHNYGSSHSPHLNIVNVCRSNPALLEYAEMYDFKNTTFSTIGAFISIRSTNDLTKITNLVFYQGDCFVTRNYLKILHGFNDQLGSEILDVMALTDSALPSYGLVVGLVTENAYNPNYRYEKGRNKFYPAAGVSWTAVMNSPEANFYNLGYKRMLNPRQFLGIDILKPTSDNSFPTRIRPSFKHILNSLKDGYLQFSDSKDFDFQYGPINALITMGDQLYSFQGDAINMHPTNERSVSQSDGNTDVPFVLGESRGLTEFKRSISTKYGTQHQWSIVKGEAGIYGFDWNKGVYWKVSGEGFKNLGLVEGCEKWIEDVVGLQSSGVSDITEQLPDNPVCNLGIHSTYNTEFKEVVTTFIFGENKNRTIVFSEKGNHFGPKHSYTPIFYAELERDMYSFSDGKFWLHESNPSHNNFYGKQYPCFVEVVVNPKGEIAKHFDNIIVNSNNREFSKVTFNTQHQVAIQDPFLGEFFCRAVYREMQWKLPIRRADSVTDPQLSLAVARHSRMRGKYLIINLEYNGDQDLWIREIITAYTQSYG